MCNQVFTPSFRSSYPLTQWRTEFYAGATLTQGSFQKLETPSPAFLSDSNCWVRPFCFVCKPFENIN